MQQRSFLRVQQAEDLRAFMYVYLELGFRLAMVPQETLQLFVVRVHFATSKSMKMRSFLLVQPAENLRLI